jgi:hypothetical protein
MRNEEPAVRRSCAGRRRGSPLRERGVTPLPFLDEHLVHVRASVAQAREAVETLAARLAERPAPRAFVTLWKLEPASGFAVGASTAERLVLVGAHRFARYELAFEVRAAEGGAQVSARTSAEFPGAMGRVYRALVIGSGGHAIAVRGMLRRIRERATDATK